MPLPNDPIQHQKVITLRGALPIIVGVGLLLTLLFSWQIGLSRDATLALEPGARPVASYGFDLSTCLIPREELIGSVARRGDIPPLNDPQTIDVAQADRPLKMSERMRPVQTPRVKAGDRVVGVVIEGQARAYPLWTLAAHEVCNDTLGGLPIAVTYSPLCDSVAVFERRLNGETLTLAASGIVYNSNTLLYDQRGEAGQPHAAPGESLWCQLQARAVAGPAARRGEQLKVLPAYVVHWDAWRRAHADTTVIELDPTRLKFYGPNKYAAYFNDERLRYPVKPWPSAEYPLKTPMAAVLENGDWRVRPAEAFDPLREVLDRPTIYSFWFAWDSTRFPR